MKLIFSSELEAAQFCTILRERLDYYKKQINQDDLLAINSEDSLTFGFLHKLYNTTVETNGGNQLG